MKKIRQPSRTLPQEARPGQNALPQWVEPLRISVRGFDWQVGIWVAGLGWKMGHGGMTAAGLSLVGAMALGPFPDLT